MSEERDYLQECADYVKAVVECGDVETVSQLMAKTSYVYLSRRERFALAWRIFKNAFRQ